MSRDVRFVRRNRVDERHAAAIAAVSGVVACLAGAEPTGSTPIDLILTFAAVAAVTWASASAPWWASSAACGIAAVLSANLVIALIGFVGFGGGLAVGVRRRDQSEVRAVIGGVAANVLIRSGLDQFIGLSAIVGITIGLALIVLGVRRRPRSIRRPAWIGLGAVGGVAIVAVLGLLVSGTSARPDVTAGAEAARSGIDLLNDGDYELAADRFEQAAQSFQSADDRLGSPLALPARLLPGVAQNLNAGNDLAGAAAEALEEAAVALRDVDVDALRVSGGAIDIEAIRATEAPLVRVEGALETLREAIADARSPWLIERLNDELDGLDADLDEQAPRLDNAIEAVQLSPQMLGEGGARRYLILFTSPAEARGLGGFVGNYAQVTIRNGRIIVDEFDRRSDLEAFVEENGATCTECPEEFLTRYGRFGFTTGPDGGVATRGWSNITMPAHFPYVAETAAALYPQSGGDVIDGVIVMDPYVVEALMQYTGPIEVPELGVTVNPDNAAEFILEDQYLLAFDDGTDGGANDERVDALETLGEEVITRLLTTSLPEPPELASDLAPLVAERRLLVWTDEPDEQAFLDRVGMLGSLPELSESDGGFSVSVTNASASKIDVFLEREVTVSVEEPADAPRRLVSDVILHNAAPSAGLPQYVIGNAVDLPTGSTRIFVSFYGPSTLAAATRDGQPFDLEPQQEAGWSVYGRFIDIGPGDTTEFRLVFDLPNRSAEDDDTDAISKPTEFTQPLSERS